MIESQYREKVNSFLKKNGRRVLVMKDAITKDKLDCAVVNADRSNQTVWVEHKRVQRSVAAATDRPNELRLRHELKRDFQLHTANWLEEMTECYYLIHIETGTGRAARFFASVLVLPSVVERSIVEDAVIILSAWDASPKLDEGFAKIVDKYERLLEVM